MKKKRKSKLITTKLDAGNVELNTAFFNNAMNVGGCGLAENQQLNEYNYNKNDLAIRNGEVIKCRKDVTSITIPSNVTSIGNGSFSGCNSLTSITIPNSVTSIGWYAFQGCSSLTSITIPNSLTSIGNSAFSQCDSLETIIVDKNNTKYDSRDTCNAIIETSTNTLIAGCKNTTIPNSVTSIGSSAFYNCISLTSITIPNSVTSIGDDAFENCSSLTSITIGNSVTSIEDHAFSGCISLTNITIPNSVTSIGYHAFNNCSSLTSITISNSVTSMGNGAFINCTSLTSITIPDGVTNIRDYAFYNCSSLTSITIPDSVTRIGNSAFEDCTSLKDVYYTGSRSDWEEIAISYKRNEYLSHANIHYTDDEYGWLDNMILDEKLSTNDWNYIDIIDKFIEGIYDLRKQSIKNEGEYSIGNLVFKEFRNLGYLDKLKDMKNKLKSKELSLESIQENSGELEESLDSWYNNRNTSWANFYRQKAGIAAGNAIDTDNLDPWAMSITCCYKNCSPELLKEVLKRY